MKRKTSKENSVVFLVEGESSSYEFAFEESVLLRTRSAKRSSSQHLAEILMSNLAELVPSVFFLSTTMVFAAVRTHFPRKNTRFYRNTVTCVTGVTSNQVKVPRLNSQHLAMVGTSNIAELSAFRYFLSTTRVFQRSEHISTRKTPVYLSIELRPINSCLSIKMKTQIGVIADVVQWLALSLFVPAVGRLGRGSKLFPIFCSFFW